MDLDAGPVGGELVHGHATFLHAGARSLSPRHAVLLCSRFPRATSVCKASSRCSQIVR
jgi:hypothetical protein